MVEQTKTLLLLIFMRHGERGDYVEEKTERYRSDVEHDTELTNCGLEQAVQAGNHFKNSLQKVENEYQVKFDEIRVESSPFLRCLQTAAKVAQVLSVPKINVNYRVSESLYDTCFDDNDIFDTLELKTKDRKTLEEEALGGVEIVDTDDYYEEVKKLYPEEDEDLNRRYDMVSKHYKSRL